jgi:hypothetical protein
MSLRSNGLAEDIRELIALADADDQTTRDAIGRAVVQALTEIDQIANAVTAGEIDHIANAMTAGVADTVTTAGAGRSAVDPLSVALAGLSPDIGAASVRQFPRRAAPTEVGAALTAISGRVGRAPRRA